MSLIQSLGTLVGEDHVLTAEQASPYLVDWRQRYKGAALCVVRPGSPEEVASVVRLCAESGAPIVPQGGNTGLCGGATPDASGNAVVLVLARMNRIRAIDLDNDTITVDAGCTLQQVQEAAKAVNRIFPLSLAAEGTCTIGGNLATNAGGTQVLRYGNARDLALGLEVVVASGETWHGLRGLRKDNTGYDLRNLVIGSEGTLGIITGATLKLYPTPAAQRTAFLALESVEHAIRLLSLARAAFGASLTAFEVMSDEGLRKVLTWYPQQRLPFDGSSKDAPYFALLELSDSESADHAQERLETVLGAAIEDGIVLDVVVAESLAQSKAMWHLRESIPLAEAEAGKSIKHDVSVPISLVSKFVQRANEAIAGRFPDMRTIVFGHLGDGNVHYNVCRAAGQSVDELVALTSEVYGIVHGIAAQMGGSISAEHGIGQHKVKELPQYKSALELDLMARIKKALDPANLLNPGKVLAR